MSEFGKKWSAWVETFWWIRGVALAISLATLIPSFVDLSRYEFLRAIHAAVIGWHYTTETVASFVNKIYFLPEIDGAIVSTIIFACSAPIPVVYAIVTSHRLDTYFPIPRIPTILAYQYQSQLTYSLSGPLAIFYIGVQIYVCTLYYSWSQNAFATSHAIDMVSDSNLGLVFFLFGTSLMITLHVLPGFARGVVYTITTIAAFEVLYQLQVPELSDAINSFACEAIGKPAPGCPDSSSLSPTPEP